MNQTFKRAMSLFMALAMVLSMVPSFGTHVHAEELETEPVIVTEAPATEAPVVEIPETEAPATEAPTQAPETEAPATEAPTEEPEVVETEAPEVTEEATEAPEVETEPVEETEAVEETTPDATEETIPEEILEEEVVEEEAVAAEVGGSLSDASIGLSAESTGTPDDNSGWKASGNGITGVVTGAATSGNYKAASITLAITNTMDSAATLKFDYSISGYVGVKVRRDTTSVTINGVVYEEEIEDSFEKELAAGESISIVLKTLNSTNVANTINCVISNLSLVSADAGETTITFEPSENGSYTVDGTTVSETTQKTDVAGTTYKLAVSVPEGYKFVGWKELVSGKVLSMDQEFNLTTSGVNYTICPVIVTNDTAVFLVGEGNYFVDLDDAVTYAVAEGATQITLTESGKVTDAKYIIPAGITLLIPRDDDYTAHGEKPAFSVNQTAPVPYLTLTLAEGTEIVVDGVIEVEAMHTTTQGSKPTGNRPCGEYGSIYMNRNSKITVNKDAVLYAWGYVYGVGSVEVNSGAKVYEFMQVADFPGGGNLAKFADAATDTDAEAGLPGGGDNITDNDYIKSFPLTQYYVQNVEVPMTLKAGAKEYIYATITVSNNSMGMAVEFIGDKGMFIPADGYIVKDYDEATDRLIVDIYGNVSVAGMALDMTGTQFEDAMQSVIGSAVFDSSRYNFGLNGNITIKIRSDRTTIAQDMMLFPGVEIYIDNGAELLIAQREAGVVSHNTYEGDDGYNVYAFDLDQWGAYVFQNKKLIPVTYSPSSNRYTRKESDLKDVIIDVNGTLTTNGYLYSTVALDEDYLPVSGGAAIISSSKTGRVVMNNGYGLEMSAYRLDGTCSNDALVDVDSAWLKNGDGTFLQTYGAEEQTTFSYCATHDKWYTGECEDCGKVETYTVKWVVDGTTVKEEEVEEGMKADFGAVAPAKEGYTFIGWDYDEDGKVDEEQPAVTADATYTAVFEINTYTVTWTDAKDTTKWENIEHGKVIDTAETADEKAYDATNHYTFSYWEDAEGNRLTEGTTKVTGDVTFTAVYTAEAHNYAKEVDGTRVDATCKETGSVTMACSCGATTVKTLEIDKTNHASDEVTKVFKDSEYHTVTHTCCGTPEVVEHDSGDVTCSCGGISFNVIFDEESVELISFTSGGVEPDGYFIDPSKPVYIKAKNKVGTGIRLASYDLGLLSVTGELEIPADKIPSNTGLRVWIDATVNVTIQLNGGSIPEAVKAEMLAMGFTVTDSAFVNPTIYNGMEWCLIEEIVAYDGHSIESVTDKDGNDYYVVGEETDATIELNDLTEDLELTINWTCNELTDVAEVPATCGADGVKAHKVCACDKAYDADGNEIADLEAWKKADGKIDATGKHVDGDDKNHDCDVCNAPDVTKHTGGTATCMAAAVCVECGESYGEKNPDNHTGKTTAVDNGDGKTHKLVCECGETTVTGEPHTYVDGICACEAVQTFTITFNGNGKNFYIYADSNYPDTLPVTVTYGTAAETIGFGEVNAENNWVWVINCDGMVLSGWNTKADGTGEHYAIGAEIKPTADMTLYAIWKEVAVGGVGLNSGEYLDLHGNVTTTMPEGGYAYYNDGTLTLNNYSYTGEGYMYQANPDITAAVYGKLKPLTIVLEGENRLKNTFDDDGSAVYADNLTIEGEGTLTAEAAYEALKTYDAMVIQGGTLNLKAPWAIFSYGTVTVSGGTVTGNGQGIATDGWAFENNVKLLKPLGGYVDEYGALCDADGDLAESFKLARAYTVTFLDKDGKQIGEAQTVEHGKSATAPTAPDVTGYTFDKWDKDFTEVTSDLTVQAVYKVIEYTLTVNVLAKGETVELTVPYGANLLEALAAAAEEGKIPAIGDKIDVNIPNDHIGYSKPRGYSYQNPEYGDWSYVGESMTMPAGDLEINQTFYTYGWIFTDPDGDGVCGAEYFTEEDKYLTGWQYVEEDFDDVEGGAWYYFETVVINDTEYYYRAEGITRVPYPTETINGITYAPNPEDLEYAEEHNKTFLDKDTGLFVFGDDGKFQQNHSGISDYEGENRKVTNGLIEWHPGVVDLAQYLYFIGDEEVGGNKLATGDVYVARNSTSRKFVIGGVYTFSESGPLCEYDGITDMPNGTKRYYEDAQLMLGNGLTKVGENYIYVRSNGELVVSGEYWIGTNDLGIATGMYDFDENGFMIDPIDASLNGVVDGVYYVNGKPYYAGLIEYEGGMIYVKSNGELATGKYWVTKVNDTGYEAGFYYFDEDGYMEQERNGIVDGYYYEDNRIVYNAGLIEYNDGLIYVRSNGMVATGTYWITNTNGLKPAGCYEFDENGYMIVTESKDGIVEENGKQYYYVDGVKQIGIGLVAYGDSYIYVKTSGELATGAYWVTNVGDTGMAQGLYEFGTDGIMIK